MHIWAVCIQLSIPLVHCHLHFWKPIPGKTLSLLSTWELTLVGPESVSFSSRLLLWNKRMLWASYWLWAHTSLLVKQGRVMFLDPKIKHFHPAVTPVSIEECWLHEELLPCTVSCSLEQAILCSPFQLPLKCVLGWFTLCKQTLHQVIISLPVTHIHVLFPCLLHSVQWFIPSSVFLRKNEVSYLSFYYTSRSNLSVTRNFVHWC